MLEVTIDHCAENTWENETRSCIYSFLCACINYELDVKIILNELKDKSSEFRYLISHFYRVSINNLTHYEPLPWLKFLINFDWISICLICTLRSFVLFIYVVSYPYLSNATTNDQRPTFTMKMFLIFSV